MKKQNISVKDSGTYVQCFQRMGELPIADLNFFDGERNLDEVVRMRDALNETIECMRVWQTSSAA